MAIISVIIPVLNEEQNIKPLYERLCDVAANSTHTFEFLFIDDGSTDGTFALFKTFAPGDNRVKTIKFSRNFGSHAACLAGLMSSKGDACAFISADMQEPPELIALFIEQWEKGYEVIMGVREGEDHKASLFSNLYYSLVRRFALRNMPKRGTDVFLIDRKVVNAITHMSEKNTSVFGLILWSGFNQIFVPYKRGTRGKGISKWTLGKKLKLFIDTFVSFSYFPIRMISFIGIGVAFLGFIYSAIVIINRLFFEKAIEGWASLMVVLLLVSGIQLIMTGIIGEYIWRSLDATRNRPSFIINQKIGFDEEDKEK